MVPCICRRGSGPGTRPPSVGTPHSPRPTRPTIRTSTRRAARHEGPISASVPPHTRATRRKGGARSDARHDAQAGVPSAGWHRAQLAFKDSMVHGILQFTPSIAFRYVLHRCKSLDIRCRESFYIMCQNTTRTKTVSGAMQVRSEQKFNSLTHTAPGFEFWLGGERTLPSASEPDVGRGVEHLKSTVCVQTDSRVGLHVRHRQ